MSLVRNPANSALDCKEACLQAFEQLRRCTPAFWTALPLCGGAGLEDFGPVLAAALGDGGADFPYAAIAAEAQRPLRQGIRAATPLALLLLAALAVDADGAADGARSMAEAALAIAQRLGPDVRRDARALHAALVAPFTGEGRRALDQLAALCTDAGTLCRAQLHLAADGFMAGATLPDLSRQLARAAALPKRGAHARAVAAALAPRARLFDRLMHGGAAAGIDSASGDVGDADVHADHSFGVWLSRLQAAVYDGDHAAARHAAGRAEALAGPLLPIGDRLSCHLFGALAWSHTGGAAAAARIGLHCAALGRLARRLDAAVFHVDIVLDCAQAARAWQHGDRLGALGGFDCVATAAGRRGLPMLAVLAWQQAAHAAQASGLAEAARHYRYQALLCWEQWGAAGRAASMRGDCAEAIGNIGNIGNIGDLGLSIAHEVNQPLAAISLHAAAACKWLQRSEPDIEQALSSLMQIGAAGQHAGEIVRSVQRLSSHQQMEMDSVPVDQTIADTLRLLDWPLRRNGVELELALALGECSIRASRVQLQQVLTNLVVNATEALARCDTDGPPRRIRVESRRCGEREIEIAVVDNGPGICPELAGRVFGSKFSTKRKGNGMGLSISLAIVRAHGGHIFHEACAPHGACFRLRLPLPAAIQADGVTVARPQHEGRRSFQGAARDRCRAEN